MRQSILVVDDEPQMLGLLERILSEEPACRVVTESNPLEVPRILEREEFDLIIADLRMPGMDGMDILRMVKAKERFEEVVIITAFGSLESATEALSLDAYDYITKPFKRDQLTGAVNRALRCQRMRRAALEMAGVLEREPYEEALEAFHGEYVRRLGERCGGDRKEMARRSGLSETELKEWGRGGDASPGRDEE